MNEYHLNFCASDEWADALKQWILPGALAGVDLGDDVLEVGPGPGRTTDLLKDMTRRLTAVEVDATLAETAGGAAGRDERRGRPRRRHRHALRRRAVQRRGLVHHVASRPERRAAGRAVRRGRPGARTGAVFAGVDSPDTPEFREMRVDDVCNPIGAEGLDRDSPPPGSRR